MQHDMESDIHHDMEHHDYMEFSDMEHYDDDLDDYDTGSSNNPLEVKNDIITRDSLYSHFDLNNDGKVTEDEYVAHIKYHCDNPDSLDHYRNKDHSPCKKTYEKCKDHFSTNHYFLEDCMQKTMKETDSTCHVSVINAMIDAITYLKKMGII